MKCIAFDFDGVLVDSYSCLPSIYRILAGYFGIESKDEFVKEAIMLEDEYDAMEIFDKRIWWEDFFKKYGLIDIDKALQIYWEERIKKSKLTKNCLEILKWLRRNNILAILAGNDGIKSMKRQRIGKSGIVQFFDEILIVGEDITSKLDGILHLIKKYRLKEEEIIFVDDKPEPINRVKNKLKNIIAIKINFRSVLKKAWEGKCVADFEINDLMEIKNII